MWWKRLSFFVSLIALLGSVFPTSASALTAEEAVMPWRDDIRLMEEVLAEIQRQADQRQNELQQQIGLLQGLKQDLQANVGLLEAQHEQEQANAGAAVGAFESVSAMDSEHAHIPRIGWGIFGYFEKRRDDTNQAIAEADAKVAAGDMAFHYAGYGWRTGTQIEQSIAATENQIADVRQALDEGTWSIHFPGVGWVNRTQAEVRIASNETHINETLASIEKGEYSVHVPHLGWVTGKQVDAMIAEQEKAVADQEQAHDDRAMNIHRSGWGWVTGVSLDARRDQRIEERRSLEIAVGELRFSHYIPGAGWVTAKALDEQIESLEEEIQETRDRAASSDYKIPGSQGWLNAQQVADLLAQPDCRPDGPRPCLDPKRRPLLHDYTHRFSPTLAVHIRLIEQEINKREAWRAQIGDHIAPRVKQIDNEVEQIGAMDNEFDQELHSARTRIQRRIDWLRDVRANQIP